MATKINWLHLSDIHFGRILQKPLWPTFKTDFYKDLRTIADKTGPLDIVFFTGDFVQIGTKQQFSEITHELESLWNEFRRCGLGAPIFSSVPGNHDLERPADGSSLSLAFGQWHSRKDLQHEFWSNEESEYRKAVKTYFSGYTDWLKNLPLPKPEALKYGLLPGDISFKLTKDNITLAVVGLNSSFLQLRKGELKGTLDLSVQQLNAVCNGDPDKWMTDSQISVLLTHHPLSWLSPEAQAHFNREIYPPGRFFSHLYGHQHKIEVSDISLGGAEPRRTRQAPSLFGLDTYEDGSIKERIHGYIAGQFDINGLTGIETLWPRKAEEGMSGSLRLRSDQRFDLNEDGFVSTKFEIEEKKYKGGDEKPIAASALPQGKEMDILASSVDSETAKQRLLSCPRIQLVAEPQHIAIRQEEQSGFEHTLRQKRIAYVVASWGVGQVGFLGSALARFRPQIDNGNIFHIKCEDATDADSFQAIFLQQAGLSLQAFAACVSPLNDQFLILDNINVSVFEPAHGQRFNNIIQAILEYCPNLRIVIVSDTVSTSSPIEVIELKALDVPEVKSYLTAHPVGSEFKTEGTPIELIHDKTDGLTVLIDSLLKRAKVSSFREALEEDSSAVAGDSSNSADELPLALVHAVSTLPRSADKNLVRAFKLLKVLTVLPFGETMESVKRFFPTEPFFAVHAIALNELSLLDVIPLNRSAPDIKLSGNQSEGAAPKLLKVPRRVREHAKTLIGDDERKEIVSAGLELCFGKKWRYGTIKMRSVPVEYQEYLDHGLGNEFALVEYLLRDAGVKSDPASTRRNYRPALFYARHLKSRERFHDLVMVSGSILPLIDRRIDPGAFSEMARLYGSALRMTGKPEQAIQHFEESLDVGGDRITKDERRSTWIEISFAHEVLKHSEKAVAAAKKALELSEADSSAFFEARATLAEITQTEKNRQAELRELEKGARSHGHYTAANNIALNLAKDAPQEEKIKLFDRVLESEDAGYTRWRGVVGKGQTIIESGKLAEVGGADRFDLVHAYSYLHAQRFGALFDQCHDIVWAILAAEKNSIQLLRLFRHSSFVWRIRDVEKKEFVYATKLSELPLPDGEAGSSIAAEKSYFIKRLRRLLEIAVGKKKEQSEASSSSLQPGSGRGN